MIKTPRMIDIAEDLMHDIERADADLTPSRVETRNRITASTMRRCGFSDEEIVEKLGYMPEPFSDK